MKQHSGIDRWRDKEAKYLAQLFAQRYELRSDFGDIGGFVGCHIVHASWERETARYAVWRNVPTEYDHYCGDDTDFGVPLSDNVLAALRAWLPQAELAEVGFFECEDRECWVMIVQAAERGGGHGMRYDQVIDTEHMISHWLHEHYRFDGSKRTPVEVAAASVLDANLVARLNDLGAVDALDAEALRDRMSQAKGVLAHMRRRASETRVPRKKVLVQHGEVTEELEEDVAPLVLETWKAGFDTFSAFEDSLDHPDPWAGGKIEIAFACAADADRWLHIVAACPEASFFNPMNVNLGPGDMWNWGVSPFQAGQDEEDGAAGGPTTLDFKVRVWFPHSDLAAVVDRLKEHNSRGSEPERSPAPSERPSPAANADGSIPTPDNHQHNNGSVHMKNNKSGGHDTDSTSTLPASAPLVVPPPTASPPFIVPPPATPASSPAAGQPRDSGEQPPRVLGLFE